MCLLGTFGWYFHFWGAKIVNRNLVCFPQRRKQDKDDVIHNTHWLKEKKVVTNQRLELSRRRSTIKLGDYFHPCGVKYTASTYGRRSVNPRFLASLTQSVLLHQGQSPQSSLTCDSAGSEPSPPYTRGIGRRRYYKLAQCVITSAANCPPSKAALPVPLPSTATSTVLINYFYPWIINNSLIVRVSQDLVYMADSSVSSAAGLFIHSCCLHNVCARRDVARRRSSTHRW